MMLKKILMTAALLTLGCFTVRAEEVKITISDNVGMTLIKVNKGKFQMGSPAGETYRRENETAHEVTVSRDFLLGKFEVTQEQYEAVMGKNPSKNQSNLQNPVDNVNWDEAMEFCTKLTELLKKTGQIPEKGFLITLPTEAQWEMACRAGTTTATSFGNTLDATQANFDGNHAYGKSDKAPQYLNATTKVGSYPANAWGFHDMHGNVLEWCRDIYQADLGRAAAEDPAGPKEGNYRVYRGGGFRDTGAFCRSAFRYFNLPHFRYAYLGFRVACVNE